MQISSTQTESWLQNVRFLIIISYTNFKSIKQNLIRKSCPGQREMTKAALLAQQLFFDAQSIETL